MLPRAAWGAPLAVAGEGGADFGDCVVGLGEVGCHGEVFAEVEEGHSIAPAWFERMEFLVGGKELVGAVAAADEHGELGFWPAVIHSGVDDGGRARRVGHEVAVPEVAVKKSRRLLGDKLRKQA